MTEWTRAPLDEIRTLADERVRYEGWLTALATRRESTPAHVYERVRQDYDERLRRVLDTLAGHAGVLRADESALGTRHAEAARLLDEQRDALAEIELRALVGEYDDAHAAQLRVDAEQAIGERERESAAVARELDEIRALLARAVPAAAAPAPSDAGAGAPSGVLPGATGATTAAGAAPVDGWDVDATARVATTSVGGDAGGGLALPELPQDAGGVEEEPRRAGSPPGERSTPAYAGQGFADAAFERSVDSADAAPAGTPVGMDREGRGTDARPQGRPEQEKTLRCQDCGAMNEPTEWYCERCGGELAAL